jgi:glycosyl transferase family 25
MSRVLSSISFPFERISAVDGQHEEVRAAAKYNDVSRLGPGEYACFQSHRKVWGELVATGYPYAMVLEDDIVISEDLGQYLNYDWIPRDADIIKMETFLASTWVDKRGVVAGSRMLHVLRQKHLGTACYVISIECARYLLEKTTHQILYPIDSYLFNNRSPVFPDIRTYQMVPAPVIQARWGGSTEDWAQSSLELERSVTKKRVTVPSRKSIIRSRLKRIAFGLKGWKGGSIPFG